MAFDPAREAMQLLRPVAKRLPSPVRRAHVARDLSTVETVNHAAEADPTDVGMTRDDVEAIWSSVRTVYRTGIHPAIALCLRRDGAVILDRTIGHSHGNGPDDPRDAERVLATPDTPFLMASASKAITAMVVHLLDQRGDLHVDDRVCDYIPEFAKNGKESITLNHVLSHRAGVPNIPAEALDLDLLGDRDHILAQLVEGTPTLPPGRFIAYHAISGGFILGEIVQRVTGRSIREVLRDEILDPLGFTGLDYGVAPGDVDTVARGYVTGLPVLPPVSTVLERALGLPFEDVTAALNDPRALTGVIPAGNIVGTANEMSRFFELLRQQGELDGVRIFEPRVIRRAVSEQSYMEFDFTLGFPFRYGLGFMLGAKLLSLYGPDTHHAFGHLGFTNIAAWADPQRRLSGAFLTSGKPVLGPHLLPWWNVMRTITAHTPSDGLIDGGRDWA